MEENTCIIAAGQKFNINRRVILWDEPGGFNGYSESATQLKEVDRKTGKPVVKTIQGKRYTPRSVDLEKLRKQVINFTVHHSATYNAKQCFNALHNVRKLSVNFIIDDDINATIYQCLDIKDIGWSQGECNKTGPGVEICYQPGYWDNPSFYSEQNRKKHGVQDHAVTSDIVHGSKLKVYKPTDAQVEACIALMWGFSELFPGINPQFPRDASNKISKTNIGNPETYNGFLFHSHITRDKIDPLGFPADYVEQEIAKRRKLGY